MGGAACVMGGAAYAMVGEATCVMVGGATCVMVGGACVACPCCAVPPAEVEPHVYCEVHYIWQV